MYIYTCIGVIVFFAILYVVKNYKKYCNTTENSVIIDPDEEIGGINYNQWTSTEIKYIYWTGDYSSTYLLCMLLLLKNYSVQPIYIMRDNYTLDENKELGKGTDKGLDKEIDIMKNIRYTLLKNNSHLATKLMPTLYVSSIKKNWQITKQLSKLHEKLSYYNKSIKESDRIARFSQDFKFPISIGLDKSSSALHEAISGNIIEVGTLECRINNKLDIRHSELYVFDNLRYPIIHLSKKEMKDIASRNNFYYLLNMTDIR
jgi:hypothetical protein